MRNKDSATIQQLETAVVKFFSKAWSKKSERAKNSMYKTVAQALYKNGVFCDPERPIDYFIRKESLSKAQFRMLLDLDFMNKRFPKAAKFGFSTIEINKERYGGTVGAGNKKNSTDGTRALKWGLISIDPDMKDIYGNYRYKLTELGIKVLKDCSLALPKSRFYIVSKTRVDVSTFIGYGDLLTSFDVLLGDKDRKYSTVPGADKR